MTSHRKFSTAMHGASSDFSNAQETTFTRYVNLALESTDIGRAEEGHLVRDFKSGIRLVELLEKLSGKKFTSKVYKTDSGNRFHYLNNNNEAVKFMHKEGMKLVGIAGSDFVDEKRTLLLGTIWTIIRHYQFAKGGKEELLEWVKTVCAKSGITVTDFATGWNDGRVLAALINAIKPGSVDISTLPETQSQETVEKMMALAEELGVPRLMLASDLAVEEPDSLSVATYASYFRDALRKVEGDSDKKPADERSEEEKSGSDSDKSDQSDSDKEKSKKSGSDISGSDKSGSEKSGSDKSDNEVAVVPSKLGQIGSHSGSDSQSSASESSKPEVLVSTGSMNSGSGSDKDSGKDKDSDSDAKNVPNVEDSKTPIEVATGVKSEKDKSDKAESSSDDNKIAEAKKSGDEKESSSSGEDDDKSGDNNSEKAKEPIAVATGVKSGSDKGESSSDDNKPDEATAEAKKSDEKESSSSDEGEKSGDKDDTAKAPIAVVTAAKSGSDKEESSSSDSEADIPQEVGDQSQHWRGTMTAGLTGSPQWSRFSAVESQVATADTSSNSIAPTKEEAAKWSPAKPYSGVDSAVEKSTLVAGSREKQIEEKEDSSSSDEDKETIPKEVGDQSEHWRGTMTTGQSGSPQWSRFSAAEKQAESSSSSDDESVKSAQDTKARVAVATGQKTDKDDTVNAPIAVATGEKSGSGKESSSDGDDKPDNDDSTAKEPIAVATGVKSGSDKGESSSDDNKPDEVTAEATKKSGDEKESSSSDEGEKSGDKDDTVKAPIAVATAAKSGSDKESSSSDDGAAKAPIAVATGDHKSESSSDGDNKTNAAEAKAESSSSDGAAGNDTDKVAIAVTTGTKSSGKDKEKESSDSDSDSDSDSKKKKNQKKRRMKKAPPRSGFKPLFTLGSSSSTVATVSRGTTPVNAAGAKTRRKAKTFVNDEIQLDGIVLPPTPKGVSYADAVAAAAKRGPVRRAPRKTVAKKQLSDSEDESSSSSDSDSDKHSKKTEAPVVVQQNKKSGRRRRKRSAPKRVGQKQAIKVPKSVAQTSAWAGEKQRTSGGGFTLVGKTAEIKDKDEFDISSFIMHSSSSDDDGFTVLQNKIAIEPQEATVPSKKKKGRKQRQKGKATPAKEEQDSGPKLSRKERRRLRLKQEKEQRKEAERKEQKRRSKRKKSLAALEASADTDAGFLATQWPYLLAILAAIPLFYFLLIAAADEDDDTHTHRF